MQNKKFLTFLLFLTLIATVSFGGLVWWKSNISPVSDNEETTSFLVPKGRSAMQIANMLHDEGLIRSSLAFKIYVQMSGKSTGINAGEFQLSPGMSLSEIVDTLGKGPVELWVTVPEGLRREEVIGKFIDALQMSEERADVFGTEFLVESESKEGYLFPDTYLFPRDISAETVVNKMLETFYLRIDEDMQLAIDESSYSLNDLVTMASIIERETITDNERPIVAGILWKRLETNGWRIQADATLQYEIGNINCEGRVLSCQDWWPVLTLEDFEVLSPYNSYTTDSLPPTPIANPGLSSLKASILPQQSEYWFYLHDPDGNIHYAVDNDGHNENVRVYLGK